MAVDWGEDQTELPPANRRRMMAQVLLDGRDTARTLTRGTGHAVAAAKQRSGDGRAVLAHRAARRPLPGHPPGATGEPRTARVRRHHPQPRRRRRESGAAAAADRASRI